MTETTTPGTLSELKQSIILAYGVCPWILVVDKLSIKDPISSNTRRIGGFCSPHIRFRTVESVCTALLRANVPLVELEVSMLLSYTIVNNIFAYC